jgi:hypothetical protein
MESPEVALKRRVLVDALTLCLERSKVCEKIDASTIRSVLEKSPDLWREGELHLETVWKILCNQPGLTAKEVAPPLLLFKAYENELGVVVRVPQALSALPRSEQVRLRDELGIPRDVFAEHIAKLQKAASTDAQKAQSEQAAERASRQMDTAPKQATAAAAKPQAAKLGAKAPKKSVPMGVSVAVGAAVLVLAGGAVWWQLRDTSQAADLGDVASFLKLEKGHREGTSLIATIADPRWDAMPKPEKEKVAGQVFDVEEKKGVQVMTLTDGNGRVRVNAVLAGPNRLVSVH